MIHIAFNLDEKYIPHCEVVISSILKNTKAKCHFHIIGVDGYESDDLVSFYPAPNINGLKVESLHITSATFYRMFLPDILPFDKVIYLDCDLIVKDDIKKLWAYNPEEIAGVLDPVSAVRMVKDYINSGVMVMNLKNLRQNNYKERLYAVKDRARTFLGDQDIINLAFKKKLIPAKWNTPSRDYLDQPKEYFDKKHASIIHYTGPHKPWKYACENYIYWRDYERLSGTWKKPVYK